MTGLALDEIATMILAEGPEQVNRALPIEYMIPSLEGLLTGAKTICMAIG